MISEIYSERVYPYVQGLKGAHFVKRNLEDWERDLKLKDIEKVSEEPKSIFDLEWDNLIILDGCRYDTFRETVGACDYRISLGSNTSEFIQRTFSQSEDLDLVYVTANAQFHDEGFFSKTGNRLEDVFYEVFETYHTDWNYEKNTVLPKAVVRDAFSAQKLFPEKRKIVHFIQPHYPFLEADFESSGSNSEGDTAWTLCEKGLIEHETVVENYKKNLEIVWESVLELNEKMDGKTVVTSDHGNFLGEGGLYGHPGRRSEVALRKVPVLILND